METVATKLGDRDYTIIVDKSGSMQTGDRNGKTRWQNAHETTFGLAAALEKHDPDGITVYAFSNKFKRYDNTTAAKVNKIWEEETPNGSTNLAAVLADAAQQFKAKKASGNLKAGGELFVVMTDGEPDSESDVEKEIIALANSLDRDEECAILFVQVGDDPGATRFLQRLDDNLVARGAKFDIVDTIKCQDVGDSTLLELVEKAFND